MHNSEEAAKNTLFSKPFTENPYPAYTSLRESEPVVKLRFPDGQNGWLVTRYEDGLTVLKNPVFIKDMKKVYGSDTGSVFTSNMLFSDPPDHKRLRGLVQKSFTPHKIAGMRSRIQAIADELLDQTSGREEMNLIDDYAFPLPIIVISEMLGVPLEDRDKFRIWSNSIIGASNQESDASVGQHMQEFIQYLKEWFANVREHPGDDMISQLVQSEEQGDRLSEQELYGVVTLMIIAGHETTVNLIGNGLLALLSHRDQLSLLMENPSLIHNTIEEMLRYNGPVEFSTSRWASEDIELNGQTIHKGELVVVALNSANRDESQFKDPDLFDITREKSPHLAFGQGIHHCLGAPLARLEGEIAILSLLQRYPNLKLRGEWSELKWRPGMIVRGVEEVPLSIK
ncbi:cytochrome P450 family protein [Paenibacillus lemnae]|uniref:Cytochrome P450 n=1 Tax=Paenibacillus lemnae TaxID=1330551 RepID=A0A848MBF9_PAELE|nr:cytochrome P450 [Paenibacillus lemnae]NMO97846.1 cytochrome P450 [Paenibacillus lemnae]